MDKFLENWRNDKKYRAKIKLLLYGLFLIFVTIYAISLNNNSANIKNDLESTTNKDTTSNESTDYKINIPNNYNYDITVTIDDKEYKYFGENTANEMTITKVIDNNETNYILKNNEYYIKDNDLYIKTTREEIYDVINYNYVNLDTINSYLSKSIKENNQYLIYLKDIILGNNTDDYFIITINNNMINVDYTPLMKEFNSNIQKYIVNIKIEEKE